MGWLFGLLLLGATAWAQRALAQDGASAPGGRAPVASPERAELMQELLRTEGELRELYRGKRPIGPAIGLVAAGGGVGLATSVIGLIWWSHNTQQRYGFDNQGNRQRYHAAGEHRSITTFALSGAASAAALGAGLTMLVQRRRMNRRIDREIEEPLQRREDLRQRLNFAWRADRRQLAASLSMSF